MSEVAKNWTQLLDLPVEILENVVSFVRWKELHALSIVCKKASALAQARLFHHCNLDAPGRCALINLRVRPVFDVQKASQFISKLPLKIFKLYRSVDLHFYFRSTGSEQVEQRFKWWLALLHLMPNVISIDIALSSDRIAIPDALWQEQNPLFREFLQYVRNRGPALRLSTLHYWPSSHVQRAYISHMAQQGLCFVVDLLRVGGVDDLLIDAPNNLGAATLDTYLANICSLSPTRLTVHGDLPASGWSCGTMFHSIKYLCLPFGDDTDHVSGAIAFFHAFVGQCPNLEHLELQDASESNLTPAMVQTLFLPNLLSFTYTGSHPGSHCSSLRAPKLRFIDCTGDGLQPKELLPAVAENKFPSLCRIRFAGGYNEREEFNEEWLMAYRQLASRADAENVEFLVEIELVGFQEFWPTNNTDMMGIIQETCAHATSYRTAYLNPTQSPLHGDGVHFPKLDNLDVTIDLSSAGSPPTPSWFVRSAPQLRKLDICVNQAPSYDFMLDLAYAVGKGAILPALETISLEVYLNRKSRKLDGLAGTPAFDTHLRAVEEDFKRLCGTRIVADNVIIAWADSPA